MKPSILFNGKELFRENIPDVENLLAKLKALPIPQPPYVPKPGDFFRWRCAYRGAGWHEVYFAIDPKNSPNPKLAIYGVAKNGSYGAGFFSEWVKDGTYEFQKVDGF